MRLISVTYHEVHKRWGFNDLQLSDINLLVGISGVGKTKILDSISALGQIANGKSVRGAKWDVSFEGIAGDKYRWAGEFSSEKSFFGVQIYGKECGCQLLSEQIFLNDIKIAERIHNETYFEGQKVVKIGDENRSIFSIISEEKIALARAELNKILVGMDWQSEFKSAREKLSDKFLNLVNSMYAENMQKGDKVTESSGNYLTIQTNSTDLSDELKQIENEMEQIRGKIIEKSSEERASLLSKVEHLQNYIDEKVKKRLKQVEQLENEKKEIAEELVFKSNLSIVARLVLVYKTQEFTHLFNQINDMFIDFFPQVEDIKMDYYDGEEEATELRRIPIIFVKEERVDHWIPMFDMSSGMLKTFIEISRLVLSEDGSIFLIDEFENGLGINCLRLLNQEVISKKNIQFIITSHHPYIINNINIDNWKIVTRNGGEIIIKSAKDYHLSDSKLEAFTQLISHPEYYEGMNA